MTPTLHRVPAADLLDPTFLAGVAQLRILARRVAPSGRPAEQRSKQLGSGIEFRDFRPYAPGDDLRRIDWNIYQRLGRVFLRLYEELQDLPLYICPDISASMHVESPPRAKAALQTAIGLAAIGMSQHDRVGVYPFAESVRASLRPRGGRDRVTTIASHLAALDPGGTTNLAACVDELRMRKLRPGLLVLISDFFDPAGLDALASALRASRHRPLLVQVMRDSDRNPDFDGDVRLIDAETADAQDVTVTAEVMARYHTAYDAFSQSLIDMTTAWQTGLLAIDADRDVLEQLGDAFASGRLVV